MAPYPVSANALRLPQSLSPDNADAGWSSLARDIHAATATHHRPRLSVSSPDLHDWGPASRPASRTSGRRAPSPRPDLSVVSTSIARHSSDSSSDGHRSSVTLTDGQTYPVLAFNNVSGAVPPPYDVSQSASYTSFGDDRASWQESSRPGSPCTIELAVPSSSEPCSRSSSAAPDRISASGRADSILVWRSVIYPASGVDELRSRVLFGVQSLRTISLLAKDARVTRSGRKIYTPSARPT